MFEDNFDPVPGYSSISISGEILLKHKCRKIVKTFHSFVQTCGLANMMTMGTMGKLEVV